MIAAWWKIFTKAGQPGWACIIPIYNLYVWCKIVGRPWWWILLMLIPLVNFIILIILFIDLAKSFGKGVGFGIGLILLPIIFFPILGFGSAQYQGPTARSLGTGQRRFPRPDDLLIVSPSEGRGGVCCARIGDLVWRFQTRCYSNAHPIRLTLFVERSDAFARFIRFTRLHMISQGEIDIFFH